MKPHGLLVLILALPLDAAAAATSPARERVAQAMAAALDQEPAAAERAALDAERAALDAQALAGGPTLEWQTEGLGSGFSRQPNAADSLRLSKEVALFGQRSSSRALRDQAEETLAVRRHAALLELAAAAGREWLELAAAIERQAVAAHRLERLDRAVTLHRKRLELGEVAGTEVRQLELERARDAAALQVLGLRAEQRAGRLRWIAGEVPLPAAGDLAALAAELPPLPEDPGPELSSGPAWQAAAGRGLLEERRADFFRRTAWGLTEAGAEIQSIPAIDGEPSFESFGLRIAVPLPWGRQGQARKAAAAAGAEAARATARTAEAELERRLDLALRGVRSAAAVLSEMAAVADSLPRTELSLAEQFRLGAISYLVYIDGLSRLDELRDDLVDARLELLAARLEAATLTADSTIFPIPPVSEENPS